MRDQLIQYVNLLFAGAPDSDDIRQEILQNTLDRYDDLVAQGKSPEAAYRLAITGIGDINEILGNSHTTRDPLYHAPEAEPDTDTPIKKILRACAVGLYILCPVPLFVLGDYLGMDALGICGTLALVAVATALIMLGKNRGSKEVAREERNQSPQQELRKSINSVIWAIGLALYFIISFAFGAWYITWVLFPIIASIQGLAKAILDLKEANRYEN